MLTWSTSTTSFNPNASRSNKPESRVAEDFLKSWDDAVFDGKELDDPELNQEAMLWRDKFPHIRVIGVSCGEHKVTHPAAVSPVSPTTLKTAMNHSKSADTVREKLNSINSKITLPKIMDTRKSLKK
ncbi:unnamed protein product [Caenorhabditis brenneri]